MSTGTRLLVDPYLFAGPGCEPVAEMMATVARRCFDLGMALTVEKSAWREVAEDADVQRRGFDLARYEPLEKIQDLPVPESVQAAARRIGMHGSETSCGDLRLLGGLVSGHSDLLVALDGRVHALADDLGLAGRVLTPADALAWLESLAGGELPVILRALDPVSLLDHQGSGALLAEECGPFDPYLRERLASPQVRVLGASLQEQLAAVALIDEKPVEGRIRLVALAVAEPTRGAQVVEPIVAHALATARRLGKPLAALLPPHDAISQLLLRSLGFERIGTDVHGRVEYHHALPELAKELGDGRAAWILPLPRDVHERLVPEAAPGRDRTQLPTLQSPLRKQIVIPHPSGPTPTRGDLLLFLAPPAENSAECLSSVVRVEAARLCNSHDQLLEQSASRPGYTLRQLQGLEGSTPSLVMDATSLGQLEWFMPIDLLEDMEVLNSPPETLYRLPRSAWDRIAGWLTLR